jgi:hypothetical protein
LLPVWGGLRKGREEFVMIDLKRDAFKQYRLPRESQSAGRFTDAADAALS